METSIAVSYLVLIDMNPQFIHPLTVTVQIRELKCAQHFAVCAPTKKQIIVSVVITQEIFILE